MLHTGFTFNQIWCISTKLSICIRDVRILDRIQKRIFRDSGYFRPEDIYGTHTWQNQNIVCILVQYIVFMMYIWLIFDQTLCISTKLRICIRKVHILDRIKNQIFGILALFAQCQFFWCTNPYDFWFLLRLSLYTPVSDMVIWGWDRLHLPAGGFPWKLVVWKAAMNPQ